MDQRQAGFEATARVQPSAVAARAPALFYLHPLLAGPIEDWPALLDGVVALGFRGIALAPPFAAASVLLADNLDAVHPTLQWQGDASSALRFIDSACRQRGLSWTLDVVLDRVAMDGGVARALPQVYGVPGGDVIDPRLGEPAAHLLPGAAGALATGWAARIGAWCDAGAEGVRLLGLAQVPPFVLGELIAEVRKPGRRCLFWGWTEDVPGAQLPALAGCGLDRTSLVLRDWDFAADWFWDRRAALRAVAPPVACIEAPFGVRVAAGSADPAELQAVLGRAVAVAAALGDGWMLPMGAERGAVVPLDPRRGVASDLQGETEISEHVIAANAEPGRAGAVRPVAAEGLSVTAFVTGERQAPGLVLINPDAARSRTTALGPVAAALGAQPLPPLTLLAGEVRQIALDPVRPIVRGRPARATTADAAAKSGRIALERVEPSVDAGRFAAKRTVGDTVVAEADVICDGHDKLAVIVQFRAVDTPDWSEARMVPLGNDRWQGSFMLTRPGRWVFRVAAWRDAFATYRDELAKKSAAGLDLRLEVMEGAALVSAAASHSPALAKAASSLAGQDRPQQVQALLSPDLAQQMAQADPRPFCTIGVVHPIEADRVAARFASWYEIFPRSMSDDESRHGTFADVIGHLPRIRDMGFDVLYFPPIHPIGRTNRKGRNNSLRAAEGEPGSPYAIGDETGGHEAIHRELGTLEDFIRLRDEAANHGLEIALDFAIQCSPDHPWLREHKGWFAWRPDGSLRYAENPPKKYEDIVNVDFYAPDAVPELWVALCDVVLFWAKQGVRTFRVDNPHTKPLPFWEWLIAEVRAAYPDAVFLAEAFTRPKVMNRLGKLGFTQSYTYFTWRNTRRELEEYFTELATSEQREFFRPNLFVNTPDINPPFLQESGRAGFLIRAALAATLSGLWGVYCGFELCEATPIPGREEYLDSEKYQLRAWDWNRPGNVVAEVAQLNRIRRRNPALQTHLGVSFLPSDNDQVIFFEKATADRSNVVLVAISLDPHRAQSAAVELPLWRWGLPDQASLACDDQLHDAAFTLAAKWQRVNLSPATPYVIWRARPAS